MLRIMCASKIHGATVTQTELHYAGSITIPADAIKKANLVFETKNLEKKPGVK